MTLIARFDESQRRILHDLCRGDRFLLDHSRRDLTLLTRLGWIRYENIPSVGRIYYRAR